MKKHLIYCISWFCFTSVLAQDIKLMTYNMRLDVAVDGENAWQHRKDFFIKQLKDYAPAIIGTQEGLPNQIKFIDKQLNDYAYIGIGRDGGVDKGEYSAIFYNKEKLELIKSSTFWLSKTPEKSSKNWDAALPRICTYGLFKDKKSSKLFWVFNTHFDHKGEKSRRKSTAIICKKIKQLNKGKYPVVFMGDLNVQPDTKVIKRFSKRFIDAKVADKTPSIETDGTFNAFKFGEPATRRIDYIFFDKSNFIIKNYKSPRDSRDKKYPSDHFPVIAEIEFLK